MADLMDFALAAWMVTRLAENSVDLKAESWGERWAALLGLRSAEQLDMY